MRIAKTAAFVISLFVTSLGFAPTAMAHIYASDGDMHIVLHIDPDDYPVINEPQTLIFIYETRNFDARDCVCTMTLKDGNKQVLRSIVPPVNQFFGRFNYTFSKPGVYDVILTGVPKSTANFKPFGVAYNIRVSAIERDGTPAPPPVKDRSDELLTLSALLVGLVSIVVTGRMLYSNFKGRKMT